MRCGVAGGERVPTSPLGWYSFTMLSECINGLVDLLFKSQENLENYVVLNYKCEESKINARILYNTPATCISCLCFVSVQCT